MWRQVRSRQFMGLKFKRQYPLPSDVLDFYCAELALVVGLDGGQHAGAVAYDRERTEFLKRQGLTVLRFWNNDVMKDMASILEYLRLHIEKRPSAQPSPRERGEGESGAILEE